MASASCPDRRRSWLDANGKRLPTPLYPDFDTLGTLEYIAQTGRDYTWFILNARIIAKEFALSGQEQNPDLTGRSVRDVLARVRAGTPRHVQAFVDRGVDVVSADTLRDLVSAMNEVPDVLPLDYSTVVVEVTARWSRSPPATAKWPTNSPRTPRLPRSGWRATTLAIESAASSPRTG